MIDAVSCLSFLCRSLHGRLHVSAPFACVSVHVYEAIRRSDGPTFTYIDSKLRGSIRVLFVLHRVAPTILRQSVGGRL